MSVGALERQAEATVEERMDDIQAAPITITTGISLKSWK